MSVETKSVQGRRRVCYESFDDLLADAEQVAGADVQTLGNWSLGEIYGHLAAAMNASIDGFPGKLPWPIRMFAKLFLRKMILRGPLRPGFKLPRDAETKMCPQGMTVDEGLAALRRAVQRQRSGSHRVAHLALGELSNEEWTEAHLRHAELHMSFVVPSGT
jgi:hypothetical protein